MNQDVFQIICQRHLQCKVEESYSCITYSRFESNLETVLHG
jgi:hypothetical protein